MDPESGKIAMSAKQNQNDIPKIHMIPNRNATVGYERTILSQNSSIISEDKSIPTETKKNQGDHTVGWLHSGHLGSKHSVLIFRTCVLADQTCNNSIKNKQTPAGAAILLNKASFMAKKNLLKDNISAKEDLENGTLMQEVLNTYGTYQPACVSPALIVKHETLVAGTSKLKCSERREEPAVRDISDVLSDLHKITYKKALSIVNTTARINSLNQDADSQKNESIKKTTPKPETKAIPKETPLNSSPKTASIISKNFNNHLTLFPNILKSDLTDGEFKENFKILSKNDMPASILHMTYKIVNSETRLITSLLQAHGLMETHQHNVFNLLWSGVHPKPDVLRALTLFQRVNHFPRSFELTRKDKLYKNIEKMQYFRGSKQFDFVPMTFLMPSEIKELFSAHYRMKGPWIVKPAASSRGRGIYIVNTPDQIPRDENVVVAKYVDRPLLIGGHKCDLRLYVCVTSIDPLLIYLYEEGLVRFATVKYDKTNKNLWNPCMHLCNYSINKYHSDYIKCNDANAENVGHKWTLSALLRHLRRQGHDTASLMSSIEDIIIKSLLSTAHTIAVASRMFVPYFNNCFELYGYDILIDDTLKPWLLEINLSPSLGCDSPLDTKVKSSLIADTLTLVGIPAVEMTSSEVTPSSQPSCKGVGLKMRIGACRRVHSAESMSPSKKSFQSNGCSNGTLTSEEARIVKLVKAQYQRKGGFVRIFPSQDSWQKYSQYLDPVTGIPICSSTVGNNSHFFSIPHNYNLLIHSHVLPDFTFEKNVMPHCVTMEQPDRLKRYERTLPANAASLIIASTTMTTGGQDVKQVKEIIKNQLYKGMKLTPGESRRAFGMFMTCVLRKIANPKNDQAYHQAELALRFLKRASSTLKMPYSTKGPSAKMSDKDRAAVISKELNDFLFLYHRDTDLYTDTVDRENCVSNIQFAQFIYGASEADLEDVLLLVLRMERNHTPFLGDSVVPMCLDIPPMTTVNGRTAKPKNTLLKYLACLTSINSRRYRQPDEITPEQDNANKKLNTSMCPSKSDITSYWYRARLEQLSTSRDQSLSSKNVCQFQIPYAMQNRFIKKNLSSSTLRGS